MTSDTTLNNGISLESVVNASSTERYDVIGIGCFHLYFPLPKGQTEKTFCGIPLDRIFWVDQGEQGKLKDAKTDCIRCDKTLLKLRNTLHSKCSTESKL